MGEFVGKRRVELLCLNLTGLKFEKLLCSVSPQITFMYIHPGLPHELRSAINGILINTQSQNKLLYALQSGLDWIRTNDIIFFPEIAVCVAYTQHLFRYSLYQLSYQPLVQDAPNIKQRREKIK